MNISVRRFGSVFLVAGILSGCSTFGASGPRTGTILAAKRQQVGQAGIQVIDVDAAVAQRLVSSNRRPLFSQAFGDGYPVGTVVGRGDALDVTIWEAPPAVLFGSIIADSRSADSAALPVGRNVELPEQVVDS